MSREPLREGHGRLCRRPRQLKPKAKVKVMTIHAKKGVRTAIKRAKKLAEQN